ncbi:hypothetical protein PIB30_063732 [Stylosanthes scabra]|uniref:Uncharacterized protein n=1 Tax=Stylosanthes scabra TaxID=79078 RepID=A0ABU6YP39_9FABA|nr:hypothetical protein [Stylosanthes scabra]
MGSSIIYYEYEKHGKFKDFDMKADAELGTFKIRPYHLDDEASVGWVKDTAKKGIGGMEPLSRRVMLTRKIPRKRSLLHLPCLWTSMWKKDYLRYIKELKRRPEHSPLCSRQVSVSDSPRGQLIDSLPVIILRVMISLEFGNRHCRV